MINSMKKSQKRNHFISQKIGDKTFPADSNVEDSCPMIVDDETQIEPQELTFAQKLQIKLDEAKLKKPSIHSNTIGIEQEFKKFAQTSDFRKTIQCSTRNSNIFC